MNGLFSRHPSPIAIRPLLGAALLSMVEAILILPQQLVPAVLRVGAFIIILLTIAALIAGIRGEREARREPEDGR